MAIPMPKASKWTGLSTLTELRVANENIDFNSVFKNFILIGYLQKELSPTNNSALIIVPATPYAAMGRRYSHLM